MGGNVEHVVRKMILRCTEVQNVRAGKNIC